MDPDVYPRVSSNVVDKGDFQVFAEGGSGYKASGEMATVVAPKCDIAEKNFFKDLKATYDHLNHGDNVQQMITIVKEQHSEDAVWLNEDEPLEMIPKSRRRQTEKVGSLLWVPANR